MAKSARSSSRKNNNQRLKKNVFGPIESARTERLAAKLLELAAQPKPQNVPETEMEDADAQIEDKAQAADVNIEKDDEAMEIDSKSKAPTKSRGANKIQKRRSKKSSIVFPKYKDRKSMKKRK